MHLLSFTGAYVGLQTGNDYNNILAENSLLSLASDSSLSPAEKEVIFIQIEQCLAKVHRIVGFYI
jgi:hypothetical protein